MSVETWDYIVIGSGSSGGVIATRLAEDPTARVLVLEAGGTDAKYFYRRPGALGLVYQVPQLKKSADWGYKTVPLKAMDNREMPYTRGRIVGGCSTVNGMLYVRGHRDNYDEWARDLGCEGWSYDEVLPLFVSEFYAGGGYDPARKSDIIARMQWYDAQLAADDYVLGFAPFTLGPTSGWQSHDYEPFYQGEDRLVAYMIARATE